MTEKDHERGFWVLVTQCCIHLRKFTLLFTWICALPVRSPLGSSRSCEERRASISFPFFKQEADSYFDLAKAAGDGVRKLLRPVFLWKEQPPLLESAARTVPGSR